MDIKADEYIPIDDFINAMVDAVAKIRVADDDEQMRLAMRSSLSEEPTSIATDLQDSPQGNMREIIDTLILRAINTDHGSFSGQIVIKAFEDVKRLGIDILSCNIQNVTDEHGLTQDFGMNDISKIRKGTSIAEVEAGHDTVITQTAADDTANDARVAAEIEMAQKNNELTIKKTELQRTSDAKEAETDVAYETQKQEQQKTIQTATVNAQIVRTEHEAELCKQKVLAQQQVLEVEISKKIDANRHTIEQVAAIGLAKRQHEVEAGKYEQERETLAKKAQADAEQYEREKNAETQKVIAEVQKYSMVQEAKGIRAKGEAEAVAIRAKTLAEAEGMERGTEAYQKYNRAAMAEMMIQVLPDTTGKITEPLSQIDKVTTVRGGSDSDNGVEAIAGDVPVVVAKLFKSMKETIGVDLTGIMKADTYDAKVNQNVNLIGVPDITLGSGQEAPHPNPDSDSIQP